MTSLFFYRLFGSWIDLDRKIERLETKGSYESAWEIATLMDTNRLKEDPLYFWTWEFGENSLLAARLALKATGYERAWFDAMHSLFLFDWKGVSDDDPKRREAENIVRDAEANIHQLRLEDLEKEIKDQRNIWDKNLRLDLQMKLAIDHGDRELVALKKIVKKTMRAGPDLHGRVP